MIQVLEGDQDDGDLTLYEMSPAQPILPVIVEAVSIDDTNTYKIQITHIQTNTITEAEIVTSEVQQSIVEAEVVEAPAPNKKAGGNRKRKIKSTPKVNRSQAKSDSELENLSQSAATSATDLLTCMTCGRHFVSTARLESHEKTHTKSRPFKCIDCGKTFTVRYSLICHTRVHTRERPYSCNLCGSRFSQASSLKTHQIYKHTKDFPYMCKFCGRGFISPGQKHEHVRRSHSKSSATTGTAGKKKTTKGKADIEETSIEPESCPLQNPEMLTACVQTNSTLR